MLYCSHMAKDEEMNIDFDHFLNKLVWLNHKSEEKCLPKCPYCKKEEEEKFDRFELMDFD